MTKMKNDKNFELIGYSVNITYNDFDQYNNLFLNSNLEEVKKEIEEIVFKKENCDDKYYVSLTPVFKILNEEYKCLSNFVEGFEDPFYDESKNVLDNSQSYISGKLENYSIETLEENIPQNLILLSKIKEISLIDDNGNTVQSSVNEMIGKLELLKKT